MKNIFSSQFKCKFYISQVRLNNISMCNDVYFWIIAKIHEEHYKKYMYENDALKMFLFIVCKKKHCLIIKVELILRKLSNLQFWGKLVQELDLTLIIFNRWSRCTEKEMKKWAISSPPMTFWWYQKQTRRKIACKVMLCQTFSFCGKNWSVGETALRERFHW